MILVIGGENRWNVTGKRWLFHSRFWL